MNLVWQLMLFMILFYNTVIISGSEVNISICYISDPDIFTGRNFVTECHILSPGPSHNLTGCPSTNSSRLTDGITGEGSPLNTDLFVGWDKQSQDTFIIAPRFDSTVPPKQVDIYFHNNPVMGIGLPPVDMLFLAYSDPHVTTGPVFLTYSNNQNLIQSNDETTMISVVITTDYETEGFIVPFSFFWLQFNFSSTNLSQALISEIKIFTEAVNITSISEISFLSVTDDVDLGGNNLVPYVEVSCTVANEGVFSWKWTDPNGAEVDASHTSVLIADLTLTSILTINNFSLSDVGQYTCEASVDDQETIPRSSTIGISAEGTVSTPGSYYINATGQTISMTCDFSGYLPAAYTITWTGPQGDALTTSGRHTITVGDGVSQSQSGGSIPGPSVLSTLIISNVETSDSGTYYCSITGRNDAQLSDSVELSFPDEPPVESDSQLPLIIGVVVGGGLMIGITTVVIILVIVCTLSQRNKHKDSLDDVALYSEVGVKPAPPPIPKYFYPASATSEYAVITKEAMEMNDIDGSSALLRQKQGVTRESPQPVKLSTNSIALSRSSYQENPMYTSADCLNRQLPSVSSIRTAGSLPNILDQEDECSPFNIYATAHPPPVPSYHGSQNGSLYEEEIAPALFKTSHTPNTNANSDDCLAPYSSIYSNPQPLKRSEALLEVTEKNICELRELGMGQFGKVYLAHTVGLSLKELKLSESSTDKSINILVAVKRLKANAEESTREAFEKEIKFMARLQHENVVRLVGVCLSKNAFIMMQYMENGDLNQFLRKHTLVDPSVNPLPDDAVNVSVLIYSSLQIASGMRYLSSLRYIHRDLATRNILVGQEFTVKIADFGMSRDLYDSYYYRISGRVILPIRWMANECFYGRFTEKTDVWAFGVTMWEIFMLCRAQPYGEMTDQEVVDDAVKGEGRILLGKPSSCPEEVYEIMKQCWIHEPEQRISFTQVHRLLEQVHARAKLL